MRADHKMTEDRTESRELLVEFDMYLRLVVTLKCDGPQSSGTKNCLTGRAEPKEFGEFGYEMRRKRGGLPK